MFKILEVNHLTDFLLAPLIKLSLASVTAFPKYHFHQLKGKRNGQFALDIDGRRSSYRLIVGFREEDLEKVFSSPVEIEILKIEEVSNHYG